MYWQEESDRSVVFEVPDDISDLSFSIKCKSLPLDHAHVLSEALLTLLPWMCEEPAAGIHLVHGAESGNGWYRPDDVKNQVLHLSRRARMSLRLPKERMEEARTLTGKVLDISGHSLEIGEAKVKPLSTVPTLQARYILDENCVCEDDFVETVVTALKAMDVPARKLLCGKTTVFDFPHGEMTTHSVMIADLEPEESVRLQQTGIGPGRLTGFGLFIPHKGIKAVDQAKEQI